MPDAQVAAVEYAPVGWPPETYTIVRRVRVEADDISTDPRSRRRRTIDKAQLALALEGTATHAYAVSFIVTNIATFEETEQGETGRDIETWFRRRTDIEDRIREAKLGAGLRHLDPPRGVCRTARALSRSVVNGNRDVEPGWGTQWVATQGGVGAAVERPVPQPRGVSSSVGPGCSATAQSAKVVRRVDPPV